ncbi:uncharacterized protein LOC125948903 [Anopheles darlingi]|uniref:uncharacterized protein LOC125948903 n=1 Tax=Anopheles darlingi TaxID=43151 RepID=UPI0021002CCA|nr:uncharacterized protein LOC125948903 [Anopheles darlingi]
MKSLLLVLCHTVIVLLLLVMDVSGQNNTLLVHPCDPGTEAFVCSVASFVYNTGKQQHSKLIHTGDNRNVRLGFPDSKIPYVLRSRGDPTIPTYDAKLHEELNRPPAVQVSLARMRKLEIPMDLQYGDFTQNRIVEVIAPEPADSGSQYALRYLDLSRNSLSDMEKLHVLVNLETLILAYNFLETLENTVFRGMHNLTTLILSGNGFEELDLAILPPSLVWLWVDGCYIRTLSLEGAHLPALEKLAAIDNNLHSLNVTMLQTVAPNLEEIFLSENVFNKKTIDALHVALDQAGIAHDGFETYGDLLRIHYPELHNDMSDIQEHLESWDAIISIMAVVLNLLCIFGWVGYRVWQTKRQRGQFNVA